MCKKPKMPPPPPPVQYKQPEPIFVMKRDPQQRTETRSAISNAKGLKAFQIRNKKSSEAA